MASNQVEALKILRKWFETEMQSLYLAQGSLDDIHDCMNQIEMIDAALSPSSDDKAVSEQEPIGEPSPERAQQFARDCLKYCDAFPTEYFNGLDDSVDRQNFAVALENLGDCAATLLNISQRLASTHTDSNHINDVVKMVTDSKAPIDERARFQEWWGEPRKEKDVLIAEYFAWEAWQERARLASQVPDGALIGRSSEADFEKNTWTFEMIGNYKVGIGEYFIIKKPAAAIAEGNQTAQVQEPKA